MNKSVYLSVAGVVAGNPHAPHIVKDDAEARTLLRSASERRAYESYIAAGMEPCAALMLVFRVRPVLSDAAIEKGEAL